MSGYAFSITTSGTDEIARYYHDVRLESIRICEPLVTEDYVIQTMPDVSPPKWHLAHTSWFFETFILRSHLPGYQPFNPYYDYLFNSYYVTHGKPYPRSQRGLLARPTVAEVMDYRSYIDEAMYKLIDSSALIDESVTGLIVLGLNHEQQHQELMLTDIKHIFAHNPLKPVYKPEIEHSPSLIADMEWITQPGGIYDIGYQGSGFAYDNETPVHKVYVQDFKLASRLITNREYIEFIEDGGYERAELWYSEAWALIHEQHLQAPMYWEQRDTQWWQFTLNGMQPVVMDEPVCHVSQYEADAFARWSGRRLPTEFEWELVANDCDINGNMYEQGLLRPGSSPGNESISQLFGDVWEWTSSAYTAYPGYKPASGSIGEYNGKFMSGQMVLRGGSFATSQSHIRASYRNFFYPKDRWQFSGIRLAEDA